jgi:hypothetical protein
MAKKDKKTVKKKKAVNRRAKAGQPTKYKPEFCQKVTDYIEGCLNTDEEKERELPTRAGVALLLDVSLVTIDTWGKTHGKFLCALEKVKTSQQSQLINRCLNGTGNATIGKMLLSANHGLHEKQETELSGDVRLLPPIIKRPKA